MCLLVMSKKKRWIDPIANLNRSNYWFFTGANDNVVVPGVVEETANYFEHYVPSSQVKLMDKNVLAAHGWVTDTFGNPCSKSGPPFLVNCGYDAAGQMLNFLYNNSLINRRNATGQFYHFDQRYYTPPNREPSDISLAKKKEFCIFQRLVILQLMQQTFANYMFLSTVVKWESMKTNQ